MHTAAWYTACPINDQAVAKRSRDERPLWWLGCLKTRRQDRYGGYKPKLPMRGFTVVVELQFTTLQPRIPLLWSPKDHMQDTGDSRRYICQQYDIVNCMFGSGVMFSWISGLPCSSSPELELKSTILALFTPLTGSKLKTAIDYFPHINFAHWRNSTDVSFNDVLLFSKMPPYFELKLELYSFLLSDQSMVWMFQKTWAKLSVVLGWWHSTTCTRSKVFVKSSLQEDCQNTSWSH